VDGQRVYAAGKLTHKCGIDHAVALDPALSGERIRHDIYSEMRLPARSMAGMTLMAMRFVDHL
jgi:hypothetical protein